MPTVDWPTGVINVTQAELTPLGGSIFGLDVDQFRQDLNGLQAAADGMPWPTTHNHVAPLSFGGTTLARVMELINGYTVTFEDGQYAVEITGGNSNIANVTNVNQVSVRPNNSAGLVQATVDGGTLITPADVWSYEVRSGLSAQAALTQANDRPTARVSLVSDGGSPDQIGIIAWLERGDSPIDTGLLSATVRVLQPDGTVIIPTISLALDSGTGMFRGSTSATLSTAVNYWADVTITDALGAVRSFRAAPTIG